ncbi:hypothetical protein BGZ59_010711 [Podila verticillata]|nr:hypothetical protein BGZ59_010711 [Podila verticillata]
MSATPMAKAPHVKLGKDTPTKVPFRAGSISTSKATSPPVMSSRVTSPPPTSPTSPISPTPNRRFSGIQSKVGSFEAINYKPKPSEKKIQSFKQDFSHVKAKVDHSAPASIAVVVATSSSTSPLGSPVHSPPTRPVRTTSISTSSTTAARLASRTPSTSRPVSMSVRTGGPQPSVSAISTSSLVSPVNSPSHSRRSSVCSTLTSPTMSPTSSRRLSKHIIPTQKADYSNVKSKVGSLENVGYKNGVPRPGSRGSSNENDRGRSQSPGAQSSTSSSNNSISKGTGGGGAGTRRSSAPSSFKIPKSKKVDYSNVRSKVGSMEFVHHVPQGGNIRVFSEKLSFREQAQSKIAKEINIAEFYQGDKSFDTLLREEEGENNGSGGNSSVDGHVLDQDISDIYANLDDLEQEPPKSLLAVLEEVTENVGALELEQKEVYQGEQYQRQPEAIAQ